MPMTTKHIGVALDLLGRGLDAGELLLVIVAVGRLTQPKKSLPMPVLDIEQLVGCLYLGRDGLIFVLGSKAVEITGFQFQMALQITSLYGSQGAPCRGGKGPAPSGFRPQKREALFFVLLFYNKLRQFASLYGTLSKKGPTGPGNPFSKGEKPPEQVAQGRRQR